jgi:hypothetical protein
MAITPETKTPAPSLVDAGGQRVAASATRATDEAQAAGAQAGQAARHSAEVVGLAASQALEQGQESVRRGFRAVAEAQRPLAEQGYVQGRQAIELTARITEAYREAAERTAADLQALTTAWTEFVRGAQQWQHAYFDLARRNLQRFGDKPQALLRASSPVELAQAQRDLYVDAVTSAITSGTTLLQLAGQIAQETARPLQERARLQG